MRQALTVGFEEAFLLVDDVDGAPLPRADEVLSWLRANLGADDSARFEPGPKPVRVEAVTLGHTNIAALRTDLSTACGSLANDCKLAVLPVDGVEEADDTAVTRHLLTALHRHGTGATRQRIAACLGIGDLVDAFRLTSEGMPLSADGHDCSAAFAQPRGSTP
ncbi:hypothetical protein ACFXPS_25675 [Nocardia sp. NPDC059091]|uniref:hypothetical protein n=1 Tax=unclassified Nocardia TaxID=2637762 RepID=UPI0036AE7931